MLPTDWCQAQAACRRDEAELACALHKSVADRGMPCGPCLPFD